MKRQRPTLFIFLLLLFTLNACAGVSGISGQATGEGTGDTGNTGTGTEALSETESGLYEDGPVSIPVTIAKLDSVNADLVTITPLETGANDNLASPWMIRKLESSEGVYVVTGTAGAVNTDEAMKIYGLNTTLAIAVIADVEDDGSFEFQINAEEGEIVAIAPMLDDESEIGPPVYGDTETGVVTLSTTNTDALNANSNIVELDGYVYFSLENEDGTFTLHRRNLDGTAVETLVENIDSQIRFITASENNVITYVTQDGRVFRLNGTAATASVSGRARYAELTWNTPETIHDFGEPVDDPEFFLPPTTRTFIASSGDIFFSNGNPLGAASTTIQDIVLTHVDAATGAKTALIKFKDYEFVNVDMGAPDTLFVSASPTSNTGLDNRFRIFKLNMLDGAAAWDLRTLIHTRPIADENILNIDASARNMIVFVTAQDTLHTFFSLSADVSDTPIEGAMFTGTPERPYSEWITVSPDSASGNALVLTCRGDGDKGSYLVIHRIGVDPPETLQRITNSESKNSCHGSYRVDDGGRVFFYRTSINEDGTEGAAQLSFINLTTIDESQLTVDD
jgi:hypothetical protein